MHEVTMNDPYGRSGASEFAGSPGPIHRGLNPLSSVSVYRVVNITVGEPQKEGTDSFCVTLIVDDDDRKRIECENNISDTN